MAEYVRFEGTTDFLVHYPALITTFTAANAINAGDWCVLGVDGRVSGSGVGVSGSTVIAGLAVRTAAAGERVACIRWGFIKNVFAGNVLSQGDFVEVVGQNFVGSYGPLAKAGSLSGSIPASAIGQVTFGPALATSATSGSRVNVFLGLF